MVVIEHNLDVIKTADHIIDLGPDGGDQGGNRGVRWDPRRGGPVSKEFYGQIPGKGAEIMTAVGLQGPGY